ncbi:hypothetical protein PGT21_016403 [Puccinia graminis f. sp. tritici]|uniref:Uncharacterized protein n=1 Tax=Puccinia graminis f. sp. tritici TaxID=56615 RepID=A0A5B0N4A7_PUCGR|nr:hypothetical protein PGT21_016403 [Puccinia graminis f. sp. tritici]
MPSKCRRSFGQVNSSSLSCGRKWKRFGVSALKNGVRVWAQAPVPRVLVPPGPGPAPRGLDLAGCAGVGPWHWPKSGLAEPKLWAHQITDIDYHHHHTRDPPS